MLTMACFFKGPLYKRHLFKGRFIEERLLKGNFLLSSFFLLIFSTPANAEILVEKLDPQNHILFMRHAIAPGFGDPVNFNLNDCSTQRNLSKEGITQAKKIGNALKETGYKFAVYSSQWCRCVDTANALNLGDITEQPLLNSFFRDGDPGDKQTLALKQWMNQLDTTNIPLLVTHQVNITGITGVFPASGEIILVEKTANRIEVKSRFIIEK